jgi:cytochrome c biogenesis protein CcdA
MSLLLGGSVAAAFAAGMVAFFAPCCAGVMLPTVSEWPNSRRSTFSESR